MRTLIAGVGNIFMADDGFGCEVVGRLANRPLPGGVDALDFGIRGIDLGLALSSGEYDAAILIDTAQRGGAPGSLYVIDVPAAVGGADGAPQMEPHAMDPARVLQLAASLGWRCPRVQVLACEPADLGGDDGRMGLSEAVAASVEPALEEVMRLLRIDQGMEKEAHGIDTTAPAAGAQRLQEA
ncbi:MAG: hydrogenase maturation protease [Rhodanobacteraceae bacterium]